LYHVNYITVVSCVLYNNKPMKN